MPLPSTRNLVAACFAAALLAGCVSPAPAPTDKVWNQHRAEISELQHWSFSGKLALRSSRGADSARLRWVQTGEEIELELSGPVGFKQVRLVTRGEQTRLFRDGQWQSLDSTERSLEEQLGWSLPLDYLPWWLRGLPAPQVPVGELLLDAGRLTRLQQAGWQVDYAAYQTVHAHSLPRTILFRREDVEGKILLKQWSLAP
jgi:outer membrane lipoprotein LolB